MRNYRAISELKSRKHGYQKTIALMGNCEKRHRNHENDYGCDNCPRMVECRKEFDYQVDNRTGRTWRLRTTHQSQANAKGSGEPDKTGGWIPQIHIAPNSINRIPLRIG